MIAAMTGDDRWNDWAWEIVSHHLIGAACGYLTVRGKHQTAATTFLAANLVYQWAGWVRHNDTLKRDVRDYVVGYGIGAAVGILRS